MKAPLLPFPAGADRTDGDAVVLNVDALFRQHAATVSRWAAGLGGPSIDVEDAVQDVFTVVQRRLPEFRSDALVTTWLFRITQRVAHSHRRRARWRRWLGGSAEDVAGRVPAPHLSPIEEYERKEAVTHLYRILDCMNEKHRTILVLTKFDGLSPDEIALLAGTKAVTVRVWLHRALVQFRRLSQQKGRGR